jgi:hypothetical protein
MGIKTELEMYLFFIQHSSTPGSKLIAKLKKKTITSSNSTN